MNKRAVGDTITWIVAFLVIFFIGLLFLSLAAYFSGVKLITFSRDSISLSGIDFKSLREQREFSFLMHSFLGEEPLKSYLSVGNFEESKIEEYLKDKGQYFFVSGGKEVFYFCGGIQENSVERPFSFYTFFVNKNQILFSYRGGCDDKK